ncbi:MAG: type II toxin-antitoxin system PemK/MazF family toxin [Candidatus Sungbacteria bacterium]|uniref:mRNA interferase n=1 Tax=Candidatus Sungiibacteriota bacterium TaxID=2750080 RepID=A0A932R1S6_9BACT|nr:type II toxin-antitoxin system PemK/MazF family toxin [Candidatus Sungbacteria bacterium]
MAKKQEIKRREIYLVSFDPTVGSEIKKTRPAVVIQNDTANRYSPVTIVAAITSGTERHPHPTDVFIQKDEAGLTVDSLVLLNQIRTMDRQRLIKRLGIISPATMKAIDTALEISVGLIDV